MVNVLIAGCGDVGCRLGVRLAAAGHRVWGLRRRPGSLPDGIFPVAADLTLPSSLGRLPPDLDLVFYTAAADAQTDGAYRRAYVGGVGNLLDALRAAGGKPPRLLFTSSTSVYAQNGGEWVDEASPTEPRGFAGRRLLEGERLVLDGLFPATVVRLGGIYGPGRTRLVDKVRRGEALCTEGPPHYTNRIHSEDAAALLAHLGSLPECETLYLGVDGRPADRCEVVRWLARHLGAPAPRAVAREDQGPRAPAGSKRCSNRKLLATGYRFLYPSYREGYSALVRETSGA